VEAKTQIARILKREASQRATGLNGEEQDIDNENEENEIDEQELASVNTNTITDDELLKIYSSQVQKWKPWWQSFESKSHLLEEIGQNTDRKPLNLNLNLLKNSSTINISKASALLHNDMLLTFYSYLIISYIYQSDLEDLDCVEDELVANFIHIDNQLVNDTRTLSLRTRLDLAVKSLTRADRNSFLKNYVSRGFLANVLDELVYFVERFDLQVQALSHMYSTFERFLKESKKSFGDSNFETVIDETPINVFYLNKEVVKKVNDENAKPIRSSNIKILNRPKIEKNASQQLEVEVDNSGVEKREKTSDIRTPKVLSKDLRVFLKRLEFYYRWLCFSKSKLFTAEYVAQTKDTIRRVKEEFVAESKRFDDESEFFDKNLAKLRNGRVKDDRPAATQLIQEL
jgi:hypothetical protein